MTQRPQRTLVGFLALIAIVSLSLGTATVGAQEVCGLANVQYNRLHSDGFESLPAASARSGEPTTAKTSETKPASPSVAKLDLGKPLGLAPKIAKGVAPTISITFPADGASLPGRAFEIRGTFTGPVNTGISVNGSPALTFGNQWVSLPVRPAAGAFAITATATTMDSLTAAASRNVTVGSTAPDIELLPRQIGNIAPAEIGFRFRSSTSVVLGNVQVDFDGNGVDDYDGPASGIPVSFRYNAPGLYTARAKSLISGNLVSTERTVLIADVVVQRERACSVYGALRAALTANDIEATLETFVAHKRESMRPFFTALGSNRPVFATRLGTIANGVIGVDHASLIALRIEGGEPIGYSVEFASGADGVWRITAF